MLSKRVSCLKGSPTLALAAKAKELKAAGKDVISLSVGEPDWDTFASIKRAGIAAIEGGQTKYTPAGGTLELKTAIASQTSLDLGLKWTPSEVTVSSGGKYVIFSALQSLLDPEDEVIIPAPYWVSYPDMVQLAGGVPVIATANKSTDFKLNGDTLCRSITNKTKLLILNSPSNPTGEMYSKQELGELAEVLSAHPRVVILSDDIYNRLVFNDEGLAPHLLHVAPHLKERTVIINGVSKTYSMTGWRLGWALGPAELIEAMGRYQSQSTSCASSITQAASVQAIEGAGPELKEALKLLKNRRDFVFNKLSALEGVEVTKPQGAFYIWPDISSFFGKSFQGRTVSGSHDFSQALLESEMVVTVPGKDFGLEGYLRLSYALGESRMQEAIDRLQRFTASLS